MNPYQPEVTDSPVEMLTNAAHELLMVAARMGYTITIETVAKQPLAIGNSVSRIHVRMSHAHYRHYENQPIEQPNGLIVGTIAPKIILPN